MSAYPSQKMDTMQKNLNPNEPPTSPRWSPLAAWETMEPIHPPTSPSYSPTSPSQLSPREPKREQTHAEWFSETLREILAQRKVDGYVYQFDKKEDDAWFTATLKELVDERTRTGYVYDLE